MTKDVLISISGLQFAEGENSEPVEVITSGSYYKKNGKHYILYDEVAEDTAGTTKNIIKLGDEVLDITKVTGVRGPLEKPQGKKSFRARMQEKAKKANAELEKEKAELAKEKAAKKKK